MFTYPYAKVGIFLFLLKKFFYPIFLINTLSQISSQTNLIPPVQIKMSKWLKGCNIAILHPINHYSKPWLNGGWYYWGDTPNLIPSQFRGIMVLLRKSCPFKLVRYKDVTSNYLSVELGSASNQELKIAFLYNPNNKADRISNLRKALNHFEQ